MKMLTIATLLVAVSMTTSFATAQTENVLSPAPTEVAAPAKAVKKAKKVKKSAKPKAAMPASEAPAAVMAVAAPAPEVATIATTTSTAPVVAVNELRVQAGAATETSTTTTAVSAVNAAPTKKWSVGLVSELSTDAEGVGNISKNGVSTTNSASFGYKLNPDLKLSLSQYFNYDASPQAKDKAVKQSFTVLKAATAKIKGIFGSDEIAPLFWVYLPTKAAIKNNYKADVDMNAILRMDAEIVWTLANPKFQIGYYINPRQSFIPTQYFEAGGDLAKATTFESTTTLIHWLSLYYNVNDNIQPYIYGGMDNRMATERFTSTKDHVLAGVGTNFTFIGGKLVLIPEVAADIDLKTNGKYANAPKWFSPEDLGYTLTASISY